jgi:hypothetical protein
MYKGTEEGIDMGSNRYDINLIRLDGYVFANDITLYLVPSVASCPKFIHFRKNEHGVSRMIFTDSLDAAEDDSSSVVYSYLLENELQTGLKTNPMRCEHLQGEDILKSTYLEFQYIEDFYRDVFIFFGKQYNILTIS